MKFSRYIGKYDYIDYYTKQPNLWFYSNSEIQAAINTQIAEIDFETETTDEVDEEFDSYEYYKEQKLYSKNIDKNNPQIVEGILIDERAKEHIAHEYKSCKIIDLSKSPYDEYSNEILASETQDLLTNEDNIVLFQPVFIHGACITIPDVIIKQDVKITLIEVKSTTTAKLHHFLDLYFQAKILRKINYLEDFYFEFNLCLIAYKIANKHEVPMIITPNINLVKTVGFSDAANTCEIKQSIKMGTCFIVKGELIEAPINISNLCDENLGDIEVRLDYHPASQTIKSLENSSKLIESLYEEYEQVIQTLINHRALVAKKSEDIIGKLIPHQNDKSPWKTPDLFPMLRNLYVTQGYDIFNYSGKLINMNGEALKNFNSIPFESFFKKNYYNEFFANNNLIDVDYSSLIKLWTMLKTKQVYFDFETINSPVRAIDGILPFCQIVTQCSIIKSENGKQFDECNNMIVDPVNITIQDFKNIIDNLYEGAEYSYIVYNASFEKSRLKEMANYINEEKYSNKVNVIIDNLHDLANYFVFKDEKCPILIKELGGFYSIKKVLPYIEHHYHHCFEASKATNYHNLNVQNGLHCQHETMMRFHQQMDDKNWAKLASDLKLYCENDVRAMIAVKFFVEEFVSKTA